LLLERSALSLSDEGIPLWAGTAVNYFDRYLAAASAMPVDHVELITLTCVLIASKFLQTKMLGLDELESLSENKGHTAADFLRAEMKVLTVLNWQLAVPSPHGVVAHLVALYCERASDETKELIQTHADEFVDLNARWGSCLLRLPWGMLAGAAFLCALRRMGMNLVDPMELCNLLGFPLKDLEAYSQVRASHSFTSIFVSSPTDHVDVSHSAFVSGSVAGAAPLCATASMC
jgi:hypothetical protein